jgi:hypothetical protein
MLIGLLRQAESNKYYRVIFWIILNLIAGSLLGTSIENLTIFVIMLPIAACLQLIVIFDMVNPIRWVTSTTTGFIAGQAAAICSGQIFLLFLPIIMSTPFAHIFDPSATLILLHIIIPGFVAGLSMGLIQAKLCQVPAKNERIWVLANIIAWIGSWALFVVLGPSSWGAAGLEVILHRAGTGAAAGGVYALATGLVLQPSVRSPTAT